MELKSFIQNVLEQMAEIKGNKHKKSYLVEELEFELSLSTTKEGKIAVAFFGIGGDVNGGNYSAGGVTIYHLLK